MGGLKTLLIGRNADCDIVLADATVSRRHAELVESTNGRFYLTDRESAAGTWLHDGADWAKVRQAFVTRDQPVLLGRYSTTVEALLKLLAEQQAGRGTAAAPADLPVGGVMRNPQTGEIVRKE